MTYRNRCLWVVIASALLNLYSSYGKVLDTLWQENWEGNPLLLWRIEGGGTWEWGVPTSGPGSSHSGVRCAATALGGNYAEPVEARLVRIDSFVVPSAAQQPRLRFWHWYSFGAGDSGRIDIRVAGNSMWQPVSPGYTSTGSGVWTLTSIDLSPYAGSAIYIGFFFHSHQAGPFPDVGPGWYVDDIAVISGSMILRNPEGFEDGIGDWYADRGTWQVGRPDSTSAARRAFAGLHCAATVLRGNYAEPLNSGLVSPTFAVPPASEKPRLRFWHWFSFGAGDYGEVQVRLSNGDWTPISDRYSATGSNVWTSPSIDLSSFSGQTVQMRFFAHAHQAGPFPDVGSGWYIDSIAIVTGLYRVDSLENWESGLGDWYADAGTWEVGVPSSGPSRAYNGLNCAATVLAGNYAEPVNARLVSPWFNARRKPNRVPALVFYHWYSFGAGDSAVVQVRTLTRPWHQLAPAFRNTSSGVYSPFYAALGGYADSTIQLGFFFHSHQAGPFPDVSTGWYIDSVAFEGLIVPVSLSHSEVTEGFTLSQNYPNPFNPETKITYSIPVASDVTLKVYDLLGREVTTLVDVRHMPGTYEATFDGSGLASGVYLYRLQAGSFSQVKKLILLR